MPNTPADKMLREAQKLEARMNKMQPGDPRKGPLAARADKLFRAAFDSK